jgi:hypothetical protein
MGTVIVGTAFFQSGISVPNINSLGAIRSIA